jgi:uracil-DNA glycosylase
MAITENLLRKHQAALACCRRCPQMIGAPVHGSPVASKILLVGQAPGSKEVHVKRPFAWTAGKTLFAWFSSIGLAETAFRERIYMAAVCRCFPGKSAGGGDRVPSKAEISNCSTWLGAELDLLQPKRSIPAGKLAIDQFLPPAKLDVSVGRIHQIMHRGRALDVIPLPHPSGASVWHRIEPGKSLLARALQLIQTHPAWQEAGRN